jgi:hypothetical protein
MRTLFGILAATSLATMATLSAQTPMPKGAMYGADPSYKVPRTPDGKPDLQGVWSNNHVTPMTRPKQWAGKETITDAELKELQVLVSKSADDGGDAIFQNMVQLALDAKDKGKFEQVSYDATTGNYNQFWMVGRDWDNRTSLVVDPPDGLLPPRTEEAEKRANLRGRRRDENGKPSRPNGPEDLPLGERCVAFGAPRTGSGYNSYLQIVQSPSTVVLLQEMAHDARIVPVGAQPHLNVGTRQWLGDPRGRWEGDTFVVETTNYRNGFQGSTPDVKVTERFTRVSKDFINWMITVDDPKTWTKPWSFMIRLKRSDDQLYEYACHEGNYSLPGILAGARAEDAAEAAAAGKPQSR